MKYPRVIYIGGGPLVGKSTVARIIAWRLGYACISTDDIGASLAAVTDPKEHPAFHYMNGLDYREYYITTAIDQLVEDIDQQHGAVWPAVARLFEDHSTWGCPAVIEGWALRPEYVAGLSGDISGLFLLADDALVEARTRADDFSAGASDPEAMIQNYLDRSFHYNARLRGQVAGMGLKSIAVSAEMTPEKIADKCITLLG